MSEHTNVSYNERNFSPRDPELPDIDEPWSELLITYSETELTYTSLEDPTVVYRVPLATQEERTRGSTRRQKIERNFINLLYNYCIHRIEWIFHSEPHIDTTNEDWHLLSLAALGDAIQIERLIFDISEQAGRYVLEVIPFFAHPYGKVRDVRLRIRNGNFSNGGLALEIVESLDALDDKWVFCVGKWKETTEVQVEVSHITTEGRKALEKVSSVIASITFDHLRQ
ncbi:hypothetical protein TRVA0_034S00166 [Trichomonascus vanleenenianus]|uniref:uncharacterized protein n=1 Tax=Trichomonascus vanleenenianus TaxID=2268995 RepID=UPI003ECAD085